MAPSEHHLKALTSEDRVLYKKWLRHSLLLYAVIALVVVGLTVATSFVPKGPRSADTSSSVAMARK